MATCTFEKIPFLTAVNQIDVRPGGSKGYLTGDWLSVYYLARFQLERV